MIAPSPDPSKRRIAVVGLGYVGLPVAVALAERHPGTIGFDVDAAKVARLAAGGEPTGAVEPARLVASGLHCTSDPERLREADVFIVAVPTPIDSAKRPDLSILCAASATVGRALRPGAVVIYESTVWPGATREVCAPVLERESGLRCGTDFTLGYSPERINPGDHAHRFETVVKVVSGQDTATLELVAALYASVVDAGVHRAASIEVAEAAKVIENVQRDLNIALMNELALIFDRLGLSTREVLEAAGTKWNFVRFHPGLVGGHCIGVDPYYLTYRAQQAGLDPQVILAGRRINDEMGRFVATRTLKALATARRPIAGARVAVLGLTFKENVPDLRNSRVADVVGELRDWGVEVLVFDPIADAHEAVEEYGIALVAREALTAIDAVVVAVPHAGITEVACALLQAGAPALVDVRGAVPRDRIPAGTVTWTL